METPKGLPENSEEKFKKHWREVASEWKKDIANSAMDPISKTRLETFIDVNFIKAYVNNPDRPSINIFINAIMEEMGTSEVEESEIYEKDDEKRIYQHILDEVRKLLVNPKNN